MTSKNRIIHMAIVAAFAGSMPFAVQAASTLALPAAAVPLAKELVTTGLDINNTGTAALYNISSTSTSFTPSAGQNLQVTVTLDAGAKFTTNPTMTCTAISPNTGASAQVGATMNYGGAGASTAIFTLSQAQITASLGAAVTALDVGSVKGCSAYVSALSVTGAHSTTLNASMTYGYGTITTETKSGPYISYVKSVSAGIVAGNDAVAQVSGGFVGLTAAVTLLSAGVVYYLGNSSGYGTAGSTLDVTTAALLTSGSLTIGGAPLSGVSATNGVYLVTAAGACVITNGITAGTYTANTFTFGNLTPAALNGGITVCAQFKGTAGAAIPAGAITAALTATAATGASADATLSSSALVNITHNGTTLVAPLVQNPSGWLSRVVITNMGSNDAAYSVSALAETGNTVTLTGAASSGTATGSKVTIVDLPTLMTATGTNRGSLVLTVAGTSANISGVYQIVSPGGSSISNYVMDIK